MSRGRRAGRVVASAGWVVATYGLLVRPWHLRWGATEDEVRRPLPGDDLVPTPIVAATRAITIDCPSEQVWPWLVQQGYARAGWYSYWIDNDFRPSPDRIVPELQHLDVGDVLRTGRDGGFTVKAVENGRYWVGLIEGELGQISVVQHLESLAGDRTRLVIRVRASFALRPAAWAFWIAFDVGDFVMMRKEMLGIKRRAEHRR